MQLLIIFIVLSILNVILNTVKSIITVKGGKLAAASINAITFFVYTYVIIYTNCELNMHLKAGITAIINFVGVYIVKYIEAKVRKDKLWKIEATIKKDFYWEAIPNELQEVGISCNYIDIGKYIIINCYCETQEDSKKAKRALDACGAKYFVSETKLL
jgi:uncharacterized protein YebE (UPF0316 family)